MQSLLEYLEELVQQHLAEELSWLSFAS